MYPIFATNYIRKQTYMLHAESEKETDLQAIAEIYSQLTPLARFKLWLVVFFLKQRTGKLQYRVNIFRRRPVKFLNQFSGRQVRKDTSRLI